MFRCLLGQWRCPQNSLDSPTGAVCPHPWHLPVAVAADPERCQAEAQGQSPPSLASPFWSGSNPGGLLELQHGPKQDREALGPQESVSVMAEAQHGPSTAAAVSWCSAGVHWDSHWNCPHSDPDFSTIIPPVLWGQGLLSAWEDGREQKSPRVCVRCYRHPVSSWA